MAHSLIQVRDLCKTYVTAKRENVEALRDLTFDIDKEEFVTCVGPSGCGKTTLLKILAGLIRRTSGETILDGRPIDGPRPDIGVVFQDPVLLPWRTVLDNTLFPIEILKRPKKGYHQRALELLHLVGLAGFEDKYPFELSGGMQQRNSLTRALIHDPSLLLMDEPFGALDALTREAMNLELLRVWHESRKTVFFITHSISEAVFLADRVIVLSCRPGTIVKVIEVGLGRPRSLSLMGTPEFTAITMEIRNLLEVRGGIE